MRRLVALWGVCALAVACGGKARQGDSVGGAAGAGNAQPLPAPKACFSLRDELSADELARRVTDTFGVTLAPATLGLSEAGGFARAQQLVDGLEASLRGATPPPLRARDFLSAFLRTRLLTSSPYESQPPLDARIGEALVADMRSELERVTNHWMLGNQATLTALFGDNTTFLNRGLADHYGLPHGLSDDWEALEVETPERAGVLTLGSFLTHYPSPPTRAMHLAAAFACTIVPPPPDIQSAWWDLERLPAKQVVQMSYGEDQVVCHACHELYIGFAVALDRFDELGRYRDTLRGVPIDTSYRLTLQSTSAEIASMQIDFANPQELGRALGAAPNVQACFARQLNETLGGRELSDTELQCLLDDFGQKQTSLWSLLAALSPNYLGG